MIFFSFAHRVSIQKHRKQKIKHRNTLIGLNFKKLTCGFMFFGFFLLKLSELKVHTGASCKLEAKKLLKQINFD